MGEDTNFRYYYKIMPLSKHKPAQPSQAQQATMFYDNMFKQWNKFSSTKIVGKDEHSQYKWHLETPNPLQMEFAHQQKHTYGCIDTWRQGYIMYVQGCAPFVRYKVKGESMVEKVTRFLMAPKLLQTTKISLQALLAIKVKEDFKRWAYALNLLSCQIAQYVVVNCVKVVANKIKLKMLDICQMYSDTFQCHSRELLLTWNYPSTKQLRLFWNAWTSGERLAGTVYAICYL